MGTAVLHPQDYLASDRDHRFLFVSESSSSAVRPSGRAFSATHDTPIPPAERGRDVGPGNTAPNRSRSLCLSSHRNSSAGLLPVPDHASQSAHKTYRRLVPTVSACRFGDISNSYCTKHFTSSQLPNFSSHASELCISSRPSVPMLDHATRAQRFLSERFPLHSVLSHERRPLRRDARFSLNPVSDNCMVDSVSRAGRTAISYQKPKFCPNSHFCDTSNPAQLQRADTIDNSIHYKKRMQPGLSHIEIQMGMQCGKPPLPEGRGKSTCTNTSVAGRKFGVHKQLKRSASEQLCEGLETPISQRPASKEATRKLLMNLSEGVVGSCTEKCGTRNIEVKLTSLAPPSSSSLNGKIEKGRPMQVFLDRMCSFKTDMAGSPEGVLPQKMTGIMENTGASLNGQCLDSTNAAVECKEVNAVEHEDVGKEDQMADISGLVFLDRDDLSKVDATSSFNNQSAGNNNRSSSRVTGSGGILRMYSTDSRSCSSVLDNDEMWVSMMNDEKWAGPSFFNSPAPSALPVPSFTFLFSRTLSASSETAKKTANDGAHMVSEKSLHKPKSTWDVAFATKDLRRLLHLDHPSCDS